MPIALQIPSIRTSDPASARELAEMLRAAEQAGFDSLWVMENQAEPASAMDPLSVLAFAAGQTTTVRLGVAILVLSMHQPVRLAREVATIDQLSGGRLTLGVGIGAPGLAYEAFGTSRRERAPRFEENLTVMRRLWTEPEVHFEGRFVTLDGTIVEPKPVQRPMPVWFGASSPPALRRTARLADGWMGAGAGPASGFASLLSQLREYLEAEGRDPSSFPIGKRVYVAIDRPKQEIDDWFYAVYEGVIPSEVALSGSADQVLEGLLELRQAGADLLLISPVGDDRPQLELVIEHLLPALR
jgi:probable F420-dependent oxidoreductase